MKENVRKKRDVRKQMKVKPDVALNDQEASMVNGIGKILLEDECLKTTFHEILNFESKDIIESLMFFVEHTETRKTTDDSFTFKDTTLIFGVECKKFSGLCTQLEKRRERLKKGWWAKENIKIKVWFSRNFCQRVSNAPDFTLVAKAIFTANSKLRINSFAFERMSWGLVNSRN